MLRFFSYTHDQDSRTLYKIKTLCQNFSSRSDQKEFGLYTKDAMPKKHEPNKRCHSKRVCAKKIRENNGYLDTHQKERQKWVQKYSPKSENKYGPCTQRSKKEKGMAYEFIKTQKYSLAQS
jgi:hypothetical protein